MGGCTDTKMKIGDPEAADTRMLILHNNSRLANQPGRDVGQKNLIAELLPGCCEDV